MTNYAKKIGARFTVIGRLFSFLWQNKMWWLIPLVVVLVGLGILIVVGQTTPIGAFIYTIF